MMVNVLILALFISSNISYVIRELNYLNIKYTSFYRDFQGTIHKVHNFTKPKLVYTINNIITNKMQSHKSL